MIDLPPSTHLHPHPSFIQQLRMPIWSPPLSPSLSIFFSQPVCVRFICLHVNIAFISPLLSLFSSHICRFIITRAAFSSSSSSSRIFSLMFTWFFSYLIFIFFCIVFHVLFLHWSAIFCPPPLAVPEGHSSYNYSFWLSSRLTPGWPGPDAAPVFQPLLPPQLMRDAWCFPLLADSVIYCFTQFIPAAAFLYIRKQ